MPQAYLFSEEGRARRGSKPLLIAITIVWLAASCGFGYLIFRYHVRGNFTSLQRVYFPLYVKSAARSFIPFGPKSTYVLLQRTVDDPKTKKPVQLVCMDNEVIPDIGDDGLIRRTPGGMPTFYLDKAFAAETKEFVWQPFVQRDDIMNSWLREHFYEGKSLTELSYPSLAGAAILFFPGLFSIFFFDTRLTRRRLRGRMLRGTRELTPKEYTTEMRREIGIGIEVFTQEGR